MPGSTRNFADVIRAQMAADPELARAIEAEMKLTDAEMAMPSKAAMESLEIYKKLDALHDCNMEESKEADELREAGSDRWHELTEANREWLYGQIVLHLEAKKVVPNDRTE